MNFPRRTFLHLAAGAAALPAVSRVARAQNYPSRPVRLIVAIAPGSGADISARLIAQWLSEQLGQPFVIENRSGGGGLIAAEAAVRAPADGYTLLLIGLALTINATQPGLKFNLIRDISPIASISREPNIMVVNLSVPAKTVPEFIAYAKSKPGKVNMASGGNGTGGHLSGELFKMMTGADMLHIPYRGGGPALTDLLSGQTQVMFATLSSSIQYIKAGKLRPLGLTTATRSEVLPDIPTVGESVPNYEASAFYGVGAPSNTPTEIIEKLNKAINAGLANPTIRARIAALGGAVLASSPDEFGRLIVEETEKWARVVKFAGIKPG